MAHDILHITNGDSLTNYLKELDFDGDFLTWQEMLCEGPTEIEIDTPSFINIRKEFLNEFYDIEINETEYISEIRKLNDLNGYKEKPGELIDQLIRISLELDRAIVLQNDATAADDIRLKRMDDADRIQARRSHLITHLKNIIAGNDAELPEFTYQTSQNPYYNPDATKIIHVFKKIDTVLNLFEFETQEPDPDIRILLEKRERARQQRNWELADQIRAELLSRGVAVRDREKIS